jgi:hypothetical protein
MQFKTQRLSGTYAVGVDLIGPASGKLPMVYFLETLLLLDL